MSIHPLPLDLQIRIVKAPPRAKFGDYNFGTNNNDKNAPDIKVCPGTIRRFDAFICRFELKADESIGEIVSRY